jgi:hypothetical protein
VAIGSKVSFWHDVCCGDSPLKISYLDLFSIAQRKDVWVVDNMQLREGTIKWNVMFTRLVQDWEVKVVISFFERLYSFQIIHGKEDRIVWSPSKRGKFEVKFYQLLTSLNKSSFSWKSIWRVKAPLQVAFFVHTTTLGKILMLDNLRKRNVVLYM